MKKNISTATPIILKNKTGKFEIGLIGLSTMGANLARNISNKKISTIVFNRTTEKTENFILEFGNQHLVGEKNIKNFVARIETPRKIIILVQAGDPVDEVIKNLLPHLDKNDIIIDCGNSHYNDTLRRQNELLKNLIHLIGCGISGGEEGALHGPSIMPGGEKKAYTQVEKILEKIAANDGASGKCVSYLGTGNSGHFVKMVHNGIEYGIMQLIAESYHLLKNIGGLNNAQLAKTYESWNKKGLLKSFLVKITSKIFSKKDNLIDKILDSAGQKGTGKWTTQAALNLGVAIPTINAAVDARIISSGKEFRKIESKRSKLFKIKISKEKNFKINFAKDVATALELSILNTYAQGFQLLSAASQNEKWNLNISEICRIWRGGCIIRSAALPLYQKAFTGNKDAADSLRKRFNEKNQKSWRHILALAAGQAIPTPAMSASLHYFDAYRTKQLPQNLIQAQRDFFGAHGYERLDKKGSFHTEWE